jgi:hypothetical protein
MHPHNYPIGRADLLVLKSVATSTIDREGHWTAVRTSTDAFKLRVSETTKQSREWPMQLPGRGLA